MRPIEFRGLTKYEREWVYGTLEWESNLPDGNVEWIIHTGLDGGLEEFYEVIPETVGQDIDREDKNGKAVYVGDVIGLNCGCCFYTIAWENGAFIPKDDGHSQVHSEDIDVWAFEFEVVGNIHKLLETKNETN
jgi:hypothetical protein